MLGWCHGVRRQFFSSRPAVESVFESPHARSMLEDGIDHTDITSRRSSTNLHAKTLKSKKSQSFKTSSLGQNSRPASPMPGTQSSQSSGSGWLAAPQPRQQQPRKRRESALASIFAPQDRRSVDARQVEEMRERLDGLDASISRIETGLNALLEASGQGADS